jgi:hypothetical protein
MKVTFKAMNGQSEFTMQFTNTQSALNYFIEKCNELGYEYDLSTMEAGGIGHDYRIIVE